MILFFVFLLIVFRNPVVKENVENNSVRPLPEWLEVDKEKMSGKVVRLANREDIDLPVEEHLIVDNSGTSSTTPGTVENS